MKMNLKLGLAATLTMVNIGCAVSTPTKPPLPPQEVKVSIPEVKITNGNNDAAKTSTSSTDTAKSNATVSGTSTYGVDPHGVSTSPTGVAGGYAKSPDGSVNTANSNGLSNTLTNIDYNRSTGTLKQTYSSLPSSGYPRFDKLTGTSNAMLEAENNGYKTAHWEGNTLVITDPVLKYDGAGNFVVQGKDNQGTDFGKLWSPIQLDTNCTGGCSVQEVRNNVDPNQNGKLHIVWGGTFMTKLLSGWSYLTGTDVITSEWMNYQSQP